MSKSTKHKQKELLSTQLNVEETPNSNSSEDLIERIQIKTTPFWIIGQKEKGYFLVMGKHQISEIMETIEEVENYLTTYTWDITLKLCLIIYNDVQKELNNQKQTEQL